MTRYLERPATATLANGDEVTINDGVYFAPPWSERDGAPYSIARVIEFLPPTAAKYNHLAHKGLSKERHVRIALFYRPSEISGRLATDHRLLFAAIHSEVHPVSWLRGKCWVRHREKIENLHDWKKKPDHFHYSKLFDPYIKREYEMLRTVTVTNVPDYVRRVLAKRYEYLVCEKEMVADLTDTYRSCKTCLEWASSQESVKCEICKLWYHMDCVNPPLLTKPSRGYSWMCSPCMDQKLSAGRGKNKGLVNAPVPETANHATPVQIANLVLARAARGKVKDKPVPIEYDKPDVYHRGWNFRYFGQYTVAEHSVDSDDPIFPRQITRLGTRFQAVVPTWEEQQQIEVERAQAGPSEQLPERGGEDTAELMSRPDPESQAILIETLRAMSLPALCKANMVDTIDKALNLHFQFGVKAALGKLAVLTPEQFSSNFVKDFDAQELEIFVSELLKWGTLESHETAKKIGRASWEVVRFYFRWRNEGLMEENAAIAREIATTKSDRKRKRLMLSYSLHEAPEVPQRAKKKDLKYAGIIRGPKYLPKNLKAVNTGVSSVLGHQREVTPDSDAEGSVWEEKDLADAKPACSACGIKKDTKWWKASRLQTGSYLCDHCGTSYRKYGVSLPYRAHLDRTGGEKRAGTPVVEPASKRQKTLPVTTGTRVDTPPLVIPPLSKLAPCAFCLKMDPKPMARCRNCTFAVHSGCYGLPKDAATTTWMCDPCSNEKSLESALDISCVLCPRQLPNLRRPIAQRPRIMPDFDFLQAVKPTEGYKWTHVLCSTFVPDLRWSDGANLRLTEGIMSMKPSRFQECTICGQVGHGAVIKCGDCTKMFHPACAWLSGYRFALELSPYPPLKPSRWNLRDVPAHKLTKFNNIKGLFTPHAWCPAHTFGKDRKIFELNDIDSSTGLSALQAYGMSSGQVNREKPTFGLLRKAKRLEDIMHVKKHHADNTIPTGAETVKQCANCQTQASPIWYPAAKKEMTLPDGLSRVEICHQCHFSQRESARTAAAESN